MAEWAEEQRNCCGQSNLELASSKAEYFCRYISTKRQSYPSCSLLAPELWIIILQPEQWSKGFFIHKKMAIKSASDLMQKLCLYLSTHHHRIFHVYLAMNELTCKSTKVIRGKKMPSFVDWLPLRWVISRKSGNSSIAARVLIPKALCEAESAVAAWEQLDISHRCSLKLLCVCSDCYTSDGSPLIMDLLQKKMSKVKVLILGAESVGKTGEVAGRLLKE